MMLPTERADSPQTSSDSSFAAAGSSVLRFLTTLPVGGSAVCSACTSITARATLLQQGVIATDTILLLLSGLLMFVSPIRALSALSSLAGAAPVRYLLSMLFNTGVTSIDVIPSLVFH